MKANRLYFKLLVLTGLIISALSGCASPKLYSVNMKYDATQVAPPAYLKAESKGGAIIAVAEFTDKRVIADKKVIGRVVEKNGTNIMVFPKYVEATKAVSDGVKDYLNKAEYQVADKITLWDLTEENIPQISAKLLIGGSIDAMEIICRRGFPTNSYSAKIRLNIVFADISEGHVVYTRRVEATSSHEHVSFSEERMGNYMSILLGEAIRNVFEDKAVAAKIREVTVR
jgi:hypothetical protein